MICIYFIIGKWVKKTYDNTLKEYRDMLKLWFQGTGGGSGDKALFESWTEEKLDRWDIDPSLYDHTDIASRPSIMIDGYARHKKYLTVIFLWDETKDYILASKYNPLTIGEGEAGMISIESDTSALTNISSISPSKTKGNKAKKDTKSPEDECKDMVKACVDILYDRQDKDKKKNEDYGLEGQSIAELMQLHDVYMRNITMNKENGTLSESKKIN